MHDDESGLWANIIKLMILVGDSLSCTGFIEDFFGGRGREDMTGQCCDQTLFHFFILKFIIIINIVIPWL